MTMRTFQYFVCPDGHKGEKKITENDQPYSEMWESVSMIGVKQGAKDVNGHITYLCTTCGLEMVRYKKPTMQL